MELVALRLLCAVAEPHTYSETAVTVECAGAEFTTKGKTVKRPGWRALDAAYRAALKNAEPDKEKRALALEDTVVLMAALVPWSIAGNVPISTIGAPMASLCLAFYLIIVPLWNFARALTQNRKNFERN